MDLIYSIINLNTCINFVIISSMWRTIHILVSITCLAHFYWFCPVPSSPQWIWAGCLWMQFGHALSWPQCTHYETEGSHICAIGMNLTWTTSRKDTTLCDNMPWILQRSLILSIVPPVIFMRAVSKWSFSFLKVQLDMVLVKSVCYLWTWRCLVNVTLVAHRAHDCKEKRENLLAFSKTLHKYNSYTILGKKVMIVQTNVAVGFWLEIIFLFTHLNAWKKFEWKKFDPGKQWLSGFLISYFLHKCPDFLHDRGTWDICY